MSTSGPSSSPLARREFLCAAAVSGLSFLQTKCTAADIFNLRAAADSNKALLAITLDLEMSRNFPTWEQTHWDYEKGNLNAETKKYAVEAARRVKEQGGRIHFFVVGQVLEQANVDWLKEIVHEGHPVGNHTYDHVNVKAAKPDQIQYRFQRAPWLIEGKSTAAVIRENIRMTNAALKSRIGVDACGFRTPGGFSKGLADRPDLQQMLLDLGFTWVSSRYPLHPIGNKGIPPDDKVFDGIVQAQQQAQPFLYDKGLIEIPMSPISDITAFRSGRWKLADFLKAFRLAVEWTIDQRAVFDFLGHPSCLYVTDPEFRTIELICELAKKAKDQAALVDLGYVAVRTKTREKKGS